jgi:DNA-binding HxlR family transcriptional regulator
MTDCGLDTVLALIGGKWKMLILYAMEACTANAEMRHRLHQSGDTDATCDL